MYLIYFLVSKGNIGISRDMDKKCVSQYNTLFCVLDGIGQIVTWRLTSDLSFATVESFLVILGAGFASRE